MFVTLTLREVPKYGVFSGPYFPVCELNTEINSEIYCEICKNFKNSYFKEYLRAMASSARGYVLVISIDIFGKEP